jgi:hypothetical protein
LNKDLLDEEVDMSYETVLDRMKTVPAVTLDEIFAYIEAVCEKYESRKANAEAGFAFLKKYTGRIDREIDCKAELMKSLDERYENID